MSACQSCGEAVRRRNRCHSCGRFVCRPCGTAGFAWECDDCLIAFYAGPNFSAKMAGKALRRCTVT